MTVRFATEDYALLRTPYLSIEELIDILEQEKSIGELLESYPHVRSALTAVNPGWLRKIDESSLQDEKFKYSWFRYLSRMALLPTPYSLMAGFSIARFDTETNLKTTPRDQWKVRADVDYSVYSRWREHTTNDLSANSRMRFRANPTLVTIHNQALFVERERGSKGAFNYHTSSIDLSSRQINLLKQYLDGGLQNTDENVLALAELQIMIPMFLPCFTSNTKLFGADTTLKQLGLSKNTPPRRQVDAAAAALANFEQSPLNSAAIVKLAESLEDQGFRSEGGRPNFHVDLVKPAQASTLSRHLQRKIQQGANILHELFGRQMAWKGQGFEFEQFRLGFVKHFDQRQVPLLQVTNSLTGIYDHRDLQRQKMNVKKSPFGHADEHFIKKIQELALACRNKPWRWDLTDTDVAILRATNLQYPPCPPPIADSFCAVARIVHPKAAEPSKETVFIKAVAGPSMFQLLGRFSWASSELAEKLKASAKKIVARHEDIIFAEVVNIDAESTGNSMRRIGFCDYEIPVFAASGVKNEFQITLSELDVFHAENRLWLYSRRLKKRVVPVASTSVRRDITSAPILQVLNLLEFGGQPSSMAWDWRYLKNIDHHPRVAYNGIILSAETWKISTELWNNILPGGSALDVFRALSLRLNWPRWLEWDDKERALSIDTSNEKSILSFLDLVQHGSEDFSLRELLPEPQDSPVTGPEGHFTHEIAVPLLSLSQDLKKVRVRKSKLTNQPDGGRRLLLAQDGVFHFKLNMNSAHQDEFIRKHLAPFMRRAAKSASIQKWFFIRFRDPDFHLRVRIFARPIDLRQRIIPSVENWVRPLLEEGILHGFRVEPYEREIERYGGLTGVSLLEEISAADSAANLKLMQIPEVLKNKVFRSMIGVISAHGLLVSLGLESQARQIADAFASSGAAESTDLIRKTRSSELAHAYREYRQPTISAVVMLSRQSHKDWIIGGLTPQLEKALAILRIRDSSIRIAVKKRRGLSHLTVSDFDFAGSVIHMCLNRLIPDSSFATDLSIFEVLRKIYRELSIRRSDIQK